jgi:hypothetical protein
MPMRVITIFRLSLPAFLWQMFFSLIQSFPIMGQMELIEFVPTPGTDRGGRWRGKGMRV